MNDKKSNHDKSIHHRNFAAKGTVVIAQGEVGNTAFLIQSGNVRVYAENADKITELATLGPGQIFGDMALFGDEPRTASIEALTDCNLIVISREMMDQKMKKSDPTIRAILPMLIARVKDSNNVLMGKKETLDDLIDVTNVVYKNVHAGLEAKQRTTLERAVYPRLEAFIKAVDDFKKLYGSN